MIFWCCTRSVFVAMNISRCEWKTCLRKVPGSSSPLQVHKCRASITRHQFLRLIARGPLLWWSLEIEEALLLLAAPLAEVALGLGTVPRKLPAPLCRLTRLAPCWLIPSPDTLTDWSPYTEVSIMATRSFKSRRRAQSGGGAYEALLKPSCFPHVSVL